MYTQQSMYECNYSNMICTVSILVSYKHISSKDREILISLLPTVVKVTNITKFRICFETMPLYAPEEWKFILEQLKATQGL